MNSDYSKEIIVWKEDYEVQDDFFVNQNELSFDSFVDESELAMIVWKEDYESRDDLLVNQIELSPNSSADKSELLRQHSQTTPLMITNTSTSDKEALDAIPISYRLPYNLDNSTPKLIKNGSPSGQSTTPMSRKWAQSPYHDNWDCEPRQRTNGKWDMYFHHKVQRDIKCRSWLEVERFEEQGIRPGRKEKGKEKGSTEKEAKEKQNIEQEVEEKEVNKQEVKRKREEKKMRPRFAAHAHYTMKQEEKTEEVILKRKRKAYQMRNYVEEFLAEAHYNLLHINETYQEDSEEISSPSAPFDRVKFQGISCESNTSSPN